MKRHTLVVEKRKVTGVKVKKLRKEGILPANIYGKGIKSLAVQVLFKEFETVYKEVGETGLIDVEVGGELRPVLIHNVQKDHMTKISLHADFFQVNLKEKVKTMVPLSIVGEPKAVSEKLGLLMQTLNEIEVNVENLAAVDEQMLVSDLKIPSGVTVLTTSEQVVVKIAALVSKEAEEEAAKEAALAEAAKAEAATSVEGAEGKPAAEGTASVKNSGESKEKKPEGEAKPEAKTEAKPEQKPQ